MLLPQSVAEPSGECERRQAWCCLQVKMCDPCLSALRTRSLSSKALYNPRTFTFFYLQQLTELVFNGTISGSLSYMTDKNIRNKHLERTTVGDRAFCRRSSHLEQFFVIDAEGTFVACF